MRKKLWITDLKKYFLGRMDQFGPIMQSFKKHGYDLWLNPETEEYCLLRKL